MPEMVPVRSSNVSSVGYDEEARELYVAFQSGETYVYSSVDEAAYQDMLTATSPGSYLARHIKNSHSYRQI